MKTPNSEVALLATNSVERNTSLDAEKLVVQHINTVPHALFFTNKLGDSDVEYLEAKIAEYETTLGYPAGLDAATVKLFIQYGISAFAELVYLHKLQNLRNLVDADGLPMSKAFNKRYTYGANGISDEIVTMRYFYESSAPGVRLLEDNPGNISNAAWLLLVNRATRSIFVPANILLSIEYLYGSYFSNFYNKDEGHNWLFNFIPSWSASQYSTKGPAGEKVLENTYDLLLQDIQEIESMIKSYKQLTNFMYFIGITDVPAKGFDFTRDLAGNTIRVVQDDKLIQSLETSVELYLALFDDVFRTNITVEKLIEDNEVVYSPYEVYYDAFNYEPFLNYDPQDLIYEMLFSDRSYFNDELSRSIMFDPVACTVDGHSINLPQMSLEVEQEDLMDPAVSTLALSFINRANIAVDQAALEPAFAIKVHGSVFYDQGLDRPILNPTVTVKVKTGYNVFLITENNFEKVMIEKFLGFYYNDWSIKYFKGVQ